MHNNITINPDLPDLYKYLTLCAIERRGINSLNEIEKKPKKGVKNDIVFVRKYSELALSYFSYKLNINSKNMLQKLNINIMHKDIELALSDPLLMRFLKELKSVSEKNLMIHLTRDNQVMEILNKNIPANHYVSLTFSINRKNYINNIIFNARFKQKYDAPPIGDKKIQISHTIDYLNKPRNYKNSIFIEINKNNIFKKKVLTFPDKYQNIITIERNNQKMYRQCIHSSKVDINKDIIKNIPCNYLIPNNYVIKPKYSEDTCCLC
tara:strand:- start:588 stop:1382 length:795 start_codon:yes stop_codon:yes gene_type:complete